MLAYQCWVTRKGKTQKGETVKAVETWATNKFAKTGSKSCRGQRAAAKNKQYCQDLTNIFQYLSITSTFSNSWTILWFSTVLTYLIFDSNIWSDKFLNGWWKVQDLDYRIWSFIFKCVMFVNSQMWKRTNILVKKTNTHLAFFVDIVIKYP